MNSIHHHPTDEIIASYVRGDLDEGRRVLVASHIELCSSCAGLVAASDHIGGSLLESVELAPVDSEALQNVLARIDTMKGLPSGPSLEQITVRPFGLKTLIGYEFGSWRWIGPGVHWRSVSVPDQHGARVFMLKAAPGTSLPNHTHTGGELTLILQGAFSHQGGRFGVGDFDEADGTVEHQPIVEAGADCICLVAMEGELRLLGLFGQIMQPFVRI
jgi:putative transcriptional regulator